MSDTPEPSRAYEDDDDAHELDDTRRQLAEMRERRDILADLVVALAIDLDYHVGQVPPGYWDNADDESSYVIELPTGGVSIGLSRPGFAYQQIPAEILERAHEGDTKIDRNAQRRAIFTYCADRASRTFYEKQRRFET